MHVLDWRALSSDSVVDVTPGVEQWHTLWFMWESPRCPEHLTFTTKKLWQLWTALSPLLSGTCSRFESLLKIFGHIFDGLMVNCASFKVTHEMPHVQETLSNRNKQDNWTRNTRVKSFWNRVRCTRNSSVLCANCACPYPPSQIFPTFPTDVPAARLELLFIWWVIVYGIC